MKLSANDRDRLKRRYERQVARFGYSPKSLGWDKGKQDLRFGILTSPFDCRNKSILDVGCGFGDLNKTLAGKTARYRYLGVDLAEDLLKIGRVKYPARNIAFQAGDFLSLGFPSRFDIVLGSGIFNIRLGSGANEKFIEAALKKAFSLCRDGIAFDFLSDKVDYRYRDTYHASPEKVLKMAYRLSRNVLLRNDYMPFEFSLFVFKDDSFSRKDTIFRRFKKTSRT